QADKPSVGGTGPAPPSSSPLAPPQVEVVLPQATQVPPIAPSLAVTQAHSFRLDSNALEAKPLQLWSIDKRQVPAMAFGSALYAGLSQFEIYLRFPGLSSWRFPIFPAIVIPVFFGTAFGPWAGLVTGGLGYLIEHYISGKPFDWSANLDLALIGLIS